MFFAVSCGKPIIVSRRPAARKNLGRPPAAAAETARPVAPPPRERGDPAPSAYVSYPPASARQLYSPFRPGLDVTGITAEERMAAKTPQKDCTLFYHKDTAALATKIAAESSHITLGEITWRSFADGFPNLYIDNAMGIRNRHVAFLASFHSPAVIFEQLSVIMQLPRMFVASFTLVLPFFPTGTAERVEDEGEVPTAVTLARILSCLPLSRGGPASLVIFDIHALQERFYFGDAVLPCFESGIPLLLNRLKQLPDATNIVVAYPDEGAWKRFHFQLGSYPEVVCTKVRDGEKRIIKLKEGDCKGKHVVIVDDLVQSGGTLLECHKVLANAGAGAVSAYVTHGVFPKDSWAKFTRETAGDAHTGFRHFWITDSCMNTVTAIDGRAPFEVLSLAGPIATAIQV